MKLGDTRLLKALRLAFYPTFEPAAAKRFQAFTDQARNARNAGDLAGAEDLYVRAIAEAEASSDSTYLSFLRFGLAQVYQEQQKYSQAETIFRQHLEEALKSPQQNTQVHGAHMGLARLYHEQGKLAEVEQHYAAALAETEKPDAGPAGELYCSTALWLARFYVEQQRYGDAEPLFERVVQTREASRPFDASLPHHLHELANVYEGQEKYSAAEELYRRALNISEQLTDSKDFMIVRALDELARFYKSRGRYAEAEELSRRSLALVEEKITKHAVTPAKGWLRRPNAEDLDATVKRARVRISEALDRLSDIYEVQGKYAESEPLRRRSLEIKQQAWGETLGRIWVDSMAAHANALHKIGREDEAAELDQRVEAILAKYPPGSVRSYVRVTSRPLKKTLRGRLRMFVNALVHPSSR